MAPLGTVGLCLLVVLISTPLQTAVQAAYACRGGWDYLTGSCYQVFSEKLNRQAAENTCQSKCHICDVHLSYILTRSQTETVPSLIPVDLEKGRDVWIGLRYYDKDRNWKWSHNSQFFYQFWNDGEPQKAGGNESCVALTAQTGYKRWKNYPCHYELPYICKYERWKDGYYDNFTHSPPLIVDRVPTGVPAP